MESRAQLLIGPRAGLQVVSSIQGENDPNLNFEPKLAYNVGIRSEFIFNHNISLLTEFYYSKKGKKVDIIDGRLSHDAIYNHLDLPIAVKYTFRGKDSQPLWEPFIRFGGFLSYWVNGKGTLSGGELETFGDIGYIVDFGENLKKGGRMYIPDANRLQAGFDLGAGVLFTLADNQFLSTELDLNIGHSYLTDIGEAQYNQIISFSDNVQATNLVVALNVAYQFGFDLQKREKAKQESGKGGKQTKVKKQKIKKKKLERKSLQYIKRRNIKIYGN